MRSAACTIVVLTIVAPMAHAQVRLTTDTGSVVETSGSAQRILEPTRALVTFAVESRAATAAQATALNGPRVRRVLAALTASRPTPDSVLVIGVSVGPNENMSRGTVVDYQARAVVRLAITALDSLGRYLDVALSSGATEVVGVVFKSDSSEAAERTAMAEAYAEAYANARVLASAAGGSLGRLLRVTTGQGYRPFDSYDLEMSGIVSAARAVPIAAQGVTVSATVSAAWRFEPRP